APPQRRRDRAARAPPRDRAAPTRGCITSAAVRRWLQPRVAHRAVRGTDRRGRSEAMTVDATERVVSERAAALRLAFATAFAEPIGTRADTDVEVLSIVVGATRYGVHLSEVLAVVADKPVTAIPSPSRALLGLAGFRGSIVSVFDMAALLGEA